VRVIPPRDAYGKDNIPDEAVLVAETCAALPDAPLRGRRVVVVGGPDGLGQKVAVDLIHRGAAVLHVQLPSDVPPSPVSDPILVSDLADARGRLMLAQGPWDAVIDGTGGGLGEAATMVLSSEGAHARLDGGPQLTRSGVVSAVRTTLVG